jgi:PKHD-type hydroxylase
MPLDNAPSLITVHECDIMSSGFNDTWYWNFPSLFGHEQIARIIEICSAEKELDAGLSGKIKYDERVRKNKVSRQDDEELYSMVREPMHLANSMSGWNYDITAIESIQYTTYYCDNNHYSWHTDTLEKDHLTDRGSDNIQNGTVRKISCSVQLDSADSYEGGEFEFMTSTESDDGGMGTFSTSSLTVDGLREKGSAIFFPSSTFHRVKPVTKGTRRSLVVWFRGPKWR